MALKSGEFEDMWKPCMRQQDIMMTSTMCTDLCTYSFEGLNLKKERKHLLAIIIWVWQQDIYKFNRICHFCKH